jgi:NADP-dependent 3-hydroxy acid dehydrogenase YdfG
MDINLRAVLFLSQAVVKDMIERGDGGAIVNVSSQAAQAALPDHTVYCM